MKAQLQRKITSVLEKQNTHCIFIKDNKRKVKKGIFVIIVKTNLILEVNYWRCTNIGRVNK